MAFNQVFTRQYLIVERLQRGNCTLAELKNYLINKNKIYRFDFDVSSRTLQRDFDAILTHFGIEIFCNKSDNTYTIISDWQNEKTLALIDALNTIQTLQNADLSAKYILFDKRETKGNEFLNIILNAIKSNKKIRFKHQKYWEDIETTRIVEPYFLKQFKYRWYLVAIENEKLKTFGLDRILEIEIIREKFVRDKTINYDDLMKNFLGVITLPNTPEIVRLKVDEFKAKYIKSQPIHSSQQIIDEAKNHAIIELYVCVTEELINEILSYGEDIEVLKPLRLRKLIKEKLKLSLKNYK